MDENSRVVWLVLRNREYETYDTEGNLELFTDVEPEVAYVQRAAAEEYVQEANARADRESSGEYFSYAGIFLRGAPLAPEERELPNPH